MVAKVIHFIDHYDSFSFNLVDWLRSGSHSWHIKHYYHDEPGLCNYLATKGEPCIFSPGPNAPADVGSSVALARHLAGKVPVLGVCLGHQIIAHAHGGRILKAKNPVHGERRKLHVLNKSRLFAGIPGPITAAVYNSLVVRMDRQVDCDITAINEDGEVHALELYATSPAPTIGVQFHPESFLMDVVTQQIRENWFTVLEEWWDHLETARWPSTSQPAFIDHSCDVNVGV